MQGLAFLAQLKSGASSFKSQFDEHLKGAREAAQAKKQEIRSAAKKRKSDSGSAIPTDQEKSQASDAKAVPELDVCALLLFALCGLVFPLVLIPQR